MGNIISKRKSLRDTIVEIDNKISKSEKRKKELIKSQGRNKKRMYFISFFIIFISVFYSYIDNQNIVIFFILSILISFILMHISILYFSYRIDNLVSYLDELKEIQKEQIEKLAEEDEFKKNREILSKYEDSNSRSVHFSRIIQKKGSMIDSVADVVLGDDPSKMYALICKECHFHNGMVPPEEYESMEFVCYNCNTYNTKKKLKLEK